MSDMFVRWAT